MSLYIAAYDISLPRTRLQVARVLGRYGERVQESVFEMSLDPDEVDELRIQLASLLDTRDFFDLYPIDDRGTRQHHRWQRDVDRGECIRFV